MEDKQMFHAFNIEDAKKYGIIEATLLANIKYWIEHNKANQKNYFDGRYWTYNSVSSWTKLFPYLSAKRIRTALKNLINAKILITGNHNTHAYDRTLWYAINEELGNTICPTGKMDLPYEENGFAPQGEPIPYINTDVNTDITHKDSLKVKTNNLKVIEEHKLNTYIQTKYPDTIAKLKVQMTAKQCDELIANYDKAFIRQILEDMDNWEPLTKKRSDVYRTMKTFIKNSQAKK